MNRRTFSKVFAGTLTAAGISTVSAAEGNPPRQVGCEVPSVVPPSGGSDSWEYVILDACPWDGLMEGVAAADIDGDGKTEVVVTGEGGIVWYRPSTSEKGVVVAHGHFGIGLALEDIDADGRKEIITGKQVNTTGQFVLCWYKSGAKTHDPWTEHVLDSETQDYPHDMAFGDVDGDGQRELVANALYGGHPALFVYKVPAEPTKPWRKQVVQKGYTAEGTRTGDLDGDGKEEIVCGPYLFSAPRAGAFSGQPWKIQPLAPDFRELCRAAIINVNGDGLLDVVLSEDAYPDGRLAWFENRLTTDPKNPWLEHRIDAPFYYPHSLRTWHDPKTKQVQVLVGEMNQGGWDFPYNWDARLLQYTALEGGKSWRSQLIYQGEGTHEAVYADLDGSGRHVIFGAGSDVVAKSGSYTGWVQMFRPRESPSIFDQYQHSLVDREKPYPGFDIHAVDVDGDGRLDIVCGAWWYKNPTWERHVIPGAAQIINAYDLDKDGRKELIGIKADADGALSSELVWLKPSDLSKDLWEEHSIGTGEGDWPQGNTIAPNTIAPLLPGGRVALVCGYYDFRYNPPQIQDMHLFRFEAPEDPKQHPWKKRVIADIPYGGEIIAYDLDGDGKLDIVAGPYWIENLGDGRFEPHLLIDPEHLRSSNLDKISRIAIADVNGDGRPDILFAVEDVDWSISFFGSLDLRGVLERGYLAPVGWLENTGSLRDRKFDVHIIDRIRSPRSLGVGDFDGDGEMEVIAGEHDPFKPCRSKCRLYAYKKADPKGLIWSRHPIDNRFGHQNGAKVVELTPGRPAIISHGWAEARYVHIWERG